jgi:UrcA family protein
VSQFAATLRMDMQEGPDLPPSPTDQESVTMNPRKIPRPRLAAVGFMAVAACAFTPALPAAELPSVRVRISDLDLTTPRGQRSLQRRVNAAIADVCVPQSSVLLRNARSRRDIRECTDHARRNVQQQLEQRGFHVFFNDAA